MGMKMEVHRVQKEVLDHTGEERSFDFIKLDKHKYDSARQNRDRGFNNCKYSGTGYPETVPSIWQEIQQFQQGQPLQGGVQVDTEAAARHEVTKKWQVSACSPAGKGTLSTLVRTR